MTPNNTNNIKQTNIYIYFMLDKYNSFKADLKQN